MPRTNQTTRRSQERRSAVSYRNADFRKRKMREKQKTIPKKLVVMLDSQGISHVFGLEKDFDVQIVRADINDPDLYLYHRHQIEDEGMIDLIF